MERTYQVLGMTCSGCQGKITKALNNIEGIHAHVDLEKSEAVIHGDREISLEELNEALSQAGNYKLQDANVVDNMFVKPQDRVSQASVYYCPMECEGEKVYFVQGKRCPVCNMYCVPIEEKSEVRSKKSEVNHVENF